MQKGDSTLPVKNWLFAKRSKTVRLLRCTRRQGRPGRSQAVSIGTWPGTRQPSWFVQVFYISLSFQKGCLCNITQAFICRLRRLWRRQRLTFLGRHRPPCGSLMPGSPAWLDEIQNCCWSLYSVKFLSQNLCKQRQLVGRFLRPLGSTGCSFHSFLCRRGSGLACDKFVG